MKTTVKQRISRSSAMVIALGVTAVGALSGLIASLLATPQYEAHVRMYVSTTGGAPVSNASYQETTASQAIALSLVKLVTSEAVTERVVDSLQLDMTPAQLADVMKTTVEPETVLIDLAVTDTSPAHAREIANASAFEFADFVDDLQVKTVPSSPKPKVTLVQPAATPVDAVSPNIPRNVGLGALAGLVVGLVLANVRRRVLRTVSDPEELQLVTGKPPLGAVPTSRVRASDGFAMVTRDAVMMESFREVRTNLVHVLGDRSSRVVLVTSSGGNEGKTTALCGIGAALADAGHRVLVVDADLREPELSVALEMGGQAGLGEAIDGTVEVGDVIHSLRGPQLDFIPAGQISLHTSEMLGSAAAEKLLTRFAEAYDYVLVDTPPVLAFTDAAVLSAYSDGVILVARHAGVDEDQIAKAVGNLAMVEAPVLGALFTFAPVPNSLKRSLRAGKRR